MVRRAKSFLISVLTLSFCTNLCKTADEPSPQKFWTSYLNPFNTKHIPWGTGELDSEAKKPFSEPDGPLKTKVTRATQSSVSSNEIWSDEDAHYDTVEGDYHYFDNRELYDQRAQDSSKRRTYNFRRFPFAKQPKPQVVKPIQAYNELESGHYPSPYQTVQKTLPPWASLVQTVVTCLPLGLAAAAVPLAFIDFTGTTTTSTVTMNPITITMTVTTTITEGFEGRFGSFGRQPLRATKQPKVEQSINVQLADPPQHDQMPIKCSSLSGNSSWLPILPSSVINGNGSTSDLTLVNGPLITNWTSADPKLMNAMESKVDTKMNLQQQSKDHIQVEDMQNYVKTDANAH